jgi:hypothetical protein
MTKRPSNPPLRGAERTAVAHDLAPHYKAGDSIRTLATRTGRSYGVVHTLLKEAGVKLRPRGDTRRPR